MEIGYVFFCVFNNKITEGIIMEKKTVTKIVGAILTGGIGSVAGSIAGKMFKGKKKK